MVASSRPTRTRAKPQSIYDLQAAEVAAQRLKRGFVADDDRADSSDDDTADSDDGEPAPQTAPNGKTKKPKGGAAREAEGTQDKDRELSAAELKAVKRKGKEAAKGGAGEDTATQGGAGGRKKEPKKTK